MRGCNLWRSISGYTISKPRAINLDRNNLRRSDEILREMPELQTCIGCGACTAVCTAGNLTEFNFRKVHTLVRRGEVPGSLRGDEQMHALRQVPSGLPAWHQYARRGAAAHQT